MGLAGVLDNRQMIAFGQFENRIHIRGLTEQMHRNNGADPALPFPDDRLTCGLVDLALRLDKFTKFFRIHVVSVLVDIHKLRLSPRLGYRFRSRDEGVGHSYNRVAGLNARYGQSKPESICAASDANAILRI